MLEIHKDKLENGLRVISAPLKNTKAVSLLVLVGTGSRYEEKANNGIAHFLEHMFFKGTNKRPTTLDIARELDSVGASYNAFTGEEYTGFFIRAESSHFDLALDILSDMLFNSKFEEIEITKEKGVILEEINMIKDLPQAYVEYVAKELLWGDEPLGRMITGLPETVSKFNRETFTSFYENFYQPQKMIVAVAGNISDNILTKIEKAFVFKDHQDIPSYEKANDEQTKPALKIEFKKTDQAHFILGFRALKFSDPRREILKVLNNVMGGAMSSRLFTEVREKRGLCYYISSDFEEYRDTGFWAASAGVDIKRIDEALKVILEEFSKIKSREILAEELKRAKENLKGRMYLGLEESLNVAQSLAEEEMFLGKIKDPDEIAKEIDKVSQEEIQNLAHDIMKPEKLNLAMVGPFEEKERFEKILDKYY